MSFFPMYMDVCKFKILVVGGGAIAADKIEKLVEFTSDITVISPEVSAKANCLIKEHGLILYKKKYQKDDIKGFDMVIVATDTVDLHREIYEESRNHRILVNSVDNTAYCDFIFPSYIKQGDLLISFSTGGASPAFTKQLRSYFLSKIPNTVGVFLENMKKLRAQIPKGKERMQKFDKMAKEFIEKNFES